MPIIRTKARRDYFIVPFLKSYFIFSTPGIELGPRPPLPADITMVVIIGGGVVGTSTAYYLSSQHQQERLTIVDAVGPAACSSGRAGAFLAGSWGDDWSKRQGLFKASFSLHEQLSKELQLQSFRKLDSFQVDLESEGDKDGEALAQHQDPWLSDKRIHHEPLKGPSGIVDPSELTLALFEKVVHEREGSFYKGTVKGFETSGSYASCISFQDGTTLEIDKDEAVVIAIGPWSSLIEDWFDVPMPVDGVLSTSIVWDDVPETAVQSALFCNEDSNGCHLEVFPRADGSLYVSGLGGSEIMSPEVFRGLNAPDPSEACVPNLGRAAAAKRSLERLMLRLDNSKNNSKLQACIRPTAPDGMPILGKVLDNVYVATAGGPWGITWGPLMGLCVAHMILDQEPPIRLAPFKPQRFDSIIYRTLLKERTRIDESV